MSGNENYARFVGRLARILLVEDDPGDQILTMRALEESGVEAECRVAEDGEEALEYLLRQGKYRDPESSPRPDLVLLDLNLPKVGGTEVLHVIREDPDLKSLVVVVLTTSRNTEDIRAAYQAGVNSYIQKPASARIFERIIQSLEDYWFRVVTLPEIRN